MHRSADFNTRMVRREDDDCCLAHRNPSTFYPRRPPTVHDTLLFNFNLKVNTIHSFPLTYHRDPHLFSKYRHFYSSNCFFETQRPCKREAPLASIHIATNSSGIQRACIPMWGCSIPAEV